MPPAPTTNYKSYGKSEMEVAWMMVNLYFQRPLEKLVKKIVTFSTKIVRRRAYLVKGHMTSAFCRYLSLSNNIIYLIVP